MYSIYVSEQIFDIIEDHKKLKYFTCYSRVLIIILSTVFSEGLLPAQVRDMVKVI